MVKKNIYTNGKLLETLREASERVDDYLGQKKYLEIKEDSWPAPKTLHNRFGSWREAKIEAGLPARGQSYNEDVVSGKEYYTYIKDESSCVVCGESFNSAICFHHPKDVEKTLSKEISAHAADKIKTEVDGCVISCFNCHQKHHSPDHPLNLDEGYDRVDAPKISDARAE
jgi:hypothetical protein